MLPRPAVSLRFLSSAPPSLLRLRPPLHARQFSFLAVATRAAARAGARVVGLGAVGVGGAAYVSGHVDGFASGLFSSLRSSYDSASQAFGHITISAGKTFESVAVHASQTASDFSHSLGSTLDSISSTLATFFDNPDSSHDHNSQGDNHDPPEPPPDLLAATGLGIGLSFQDDSQAASINDSTHGLMHLTRKLIEIRSLLMSIDKDESLILPSIVVIGSQSSGKSSVLEAIVGHEFLPKGNNMVTRRPLELTLIHTPPTPGNPNPPKDYVECEQFGPGRFDDFRDVQRRLTRLNLDVPDSIAVDSQPIHLKVYSPNVPDLSLVDLPGYVQLSSIDQPEELRDKISQLCDKYIRKPNIILSVCAADVDLANSPALRASKKVDPHGYRTIGVVTKLDLVDPSVGAAILSNEKYRLALGYVGVICKPPSSSSSPFENRLLKRHSSTNSQLELAKNEHEFFRTHAEHYDQPNLLLGTDTLKQKLMKVLEESMSSSLHDISNRVSLELEETSYQFKLQYNDRCISPESYVAETMDSIKRQLIDFSKVLMKPEVRDLLRRELDQRVLGLLAEIYWSDRRVVELSKLGDSKAGTQGLDAHWIHRLEAAQSRLTKGGVGRLSAELVADEIRFAVQRILEPPPMTYHPDASQELMAITEDILDGLKARTADHVEIAVMPYRYEIEIENSEWESGRRRSSVLMDEEIKMCEQFLKSEKVELRKNWRFREALEHVKEDEERMRRRAQRRLSMESGHANEEIPLDEPEEPRPPPVLLDRARRLRDMEMRLEILKSRSNSISKSMNCKKLIKNQNLHMSSSSSHTSNSTNSNTSPSTTLCPEIFLNVLVDKLTKTTTDFIFIDLVNRFFSIIPHEINSRLIQKKLLLNEEEGLKFSKENDEVKKHLELQDRKDKLEIVMRELMALSYMKQSHEPNSNLTTGSSTMIPATKSMKKYYYDDHLQQQMQHGVLRKKLNGSSLNDQKEDENRNTTAGNSSRWWS